MIPPLTHTRTDTYLNINKRFLDCILFVFVLGFGTEIPKVILNIYGCYVCICMCMRLRLNTKILITADLFYFLTLTRQYYTDFLTSLGKQYAFTLIEL